VVVCRGRGDWGREDMSVGGEESRQVGEGLLLVGRQGGEGQKRIDAGASGEHLEESLRGHGESWLMTGCGQCGEMLGCEVGGDEAGLALLGRLLSLLLLLWG